MLMHNLLLRSGGQPEIQFWLRYARRHAIGDQIRRDGADRVLGSWGAGPEEAGCCGLRCQDRRRSYLVDPRLWNGAVAGTDFGRQDLLEPLFLSDLFDGLEVLRA